MSPGTSPRLKKFANLTTGRDHDFGDEIEKSRKLLFDCFVIIEGSSFYGNSIDPRDVKGSFIRWRRLWRKRREFESSGQILGKSHLKCTIQIARLNF
jgi:hypothetical protein